MEYLKLSHDLLPLEQTYLRGLDAISEDRGIQTKKIVEVKMFIPSIFTYRTLLISKLGACLDPSQVCDSTQLLLPKKCKHLPFMWNLLLSIIFRSNSIQESLI